MSYKCPLCQSTITKATYDKVSGVEKEREKAQENLRRQLVREKEKLAKDKSELVNKYKKEKIQTGKNRCAQRTIFSSFHDGTLNREVHEDVRKKDDFKE
jgi:hypothetical protein